MEKNNLSVPKGFEEILHDFTRDVLRDKPNNIVKYGAEYFQALQQGKKFEYNREKDIAQPKVEELPTQKCVPKQTASTFKLHCGRFGHHLGKTEQQIERDEEHGLFETNDKLLHLKEDGKFSLIYNNVYEREDRNYETESRVTSVSVYGQYIRESESVWLCNITSGDYRYVNTNINEQYTGSNLTGKFLVEAMGPTTVQVKNLFVARPNGREVTRIYVVQGLPLQQHIDK